MHNKPHTEEAKARMRLARSQQPRKWGHLPAGDIARRLLTTDATARSIAAEYGCSDSVIKQILREHSTAEERLEAKRNKQAATLRGHKHTPEFGATVRARMVGSDNPFYGKRHSDEFRASQAERQRGVKHSPQSRMAMSAGTQGVPLDQWQGCKTPGNERARRSPEFAAWRKGVYERDNYTCRLCGKRGGVLHPHHIKRFSEFPDLRYVVANGVTLCARPCHKSTMGREAEFEGLFTNP